MTNFLDTACRLNCRYTLRFTDILFPHGLYLNFLGPFLSLSLWKSSVCVYKWARINTYHVVNPLNAELNPICHLLALLGGATIVVVSRLRVKGKEQNKFFMNLKKD